MKYINYIFLCLLPVNVYAQLSLTGERYNDLTVCYALASGSSGNYHEVEYEVATNRAFALMFMSGEEKSNLPDHLVPKAMLTNKDEYIGKLTDSHMDTHDLSDEELKNLNKKCEPLYREADEWCNKNGCLYKD